MTNSSIKRPVFGSPFWCGGADAFYNEPIRPHKIMVVSNHNTIEVTALTPSEQADYINGYQYASNQHLINNTQTCKTKH